MEAVTQARTRQEEAKRLHEQKCQDAAEAETIFNGAVKDTLEKTETLEKTREDGDHEGGVSGDHGGRLLQYAPPPPGKKHRGI